MSTETIYAISSLWKLAGILFLLIVAGLIATVFKSQTRNFLDRCSRFRFKRGSTELSVNDGEISSKPISTSNTQQDVSIESAKAEISITKKEGAEEPQIELNYEIEMYSAFVDDDLGKARDCYNKIQSKETNENIKIKNEAEYLFLTFRKGDISSQKKIQELAEKHANNSDLLTTILSYDAGCYQFSGQIETAVKLYIQAAENSPTEEKRVGRIISASSALQKCNRHLEARKLLISQIKKITTNSAKAKLYIGIANSYDVKKEPEKRALMFEKALSISPIDTTTQFNAGYAYSECGLSALCILHYNKTLDINYKQDNVLNNIGIELGKLKMPVLSVDAYKDSIHEGSTLAAANLAFVLMDAGAIAEARDIITNAQNTKNLHENIHHAQIKLSKIRENENERKARVCEVAEQQRGFLLDYCDALLNDDIVGDYSNTKWTIEDGQIIEFKISDSKIEIEWEQKGRTAYPLKEKFKFSGKPEGFIAKGKLENCTKTLLSDLAPNDFGIAHAYFSKNGDLLKLFSVNKDANQVVHATFSQASPSSSS